MYPHRVAHSLSGFWMILAMVIASGCITPRSDSKGSAVPSRSVTSQPTLAHEILRLEADDLHGLADRRPLLDRLLTAVLAELDRCSSPRNEREKALQFVTVVDNVLVKHNFIYPPKGAVTLLSDALTPRKLSAPEIELAMQRPGNLRRQFQIRRNAFQKGDFYLADCDTSSLIYLAAAEIKGYPCHLVEVPGHSFVRWSFKEGSINWESNVGEERSDESYQLGSQLPAPLSACLPYLKSMSREETLGYWTTIVGRECVKQRNYAEAAKRFEEACRLAPKSFYAAHERTWFLATCPDPTFRNGSLAVGLFTPIVACWPEPNFIDTLAAAHAEAGDFITAIDLEKRAEANSRIWRRSGFVRDPWPKFQLMIEIYSRRMTYAQFFARQP